LVKRSKSKEPKDTNITSPVASWMKTKWTQNLKKYPQVIIKQSMY
jgi:hypothetical protein